ncbi:hypothetical protein SRABI134_01202 [Peribacillus sp. Bi134]|nr:hypothetical protein SRABI134_01202 [Peribacillus sp. Bi134]
MAVMAETYQKTVNGHNGHNGTFESYMLHDMDNQNGR